MDSRRFRFLSFRTMQIVALTVFVWVVFSCAMPWDREGGTILLTFDSPGASIHTVVPDSIIPDHYIVTVSNGVDADIVTDPVSGSSVTLDIPAGVWDISVEGFETTGMPICAGDIADVLITSGAVETIEILLFPLETGAGTLSFSVDWSQATSANVDSGATEITINGQPILLTAAEITTSPGSIAYEAQHPAGEYTVVINVFADVPWPTSYVELFRVYGNLESNSNVVLLDSDFTLPPAVPSAFTSQETGGSVVLTWNDNAVTETGFVLERCEDSGFIGGTLTSFQLPAGSESYTDDSSLVAGTEYYYRLASTNSAGNSSWVETSLTYGGDVELTIVIEQPVALPITFSLADDVDAYVDDTFVLSVNEAFDDYAWYLDGTELTDFAGFNGVSFVPTTEGIDPGVHHITVYATQDGSLYSNSYRFRIIN